MENPLFKIAFLTDQNTLGNLMENPLFKIAFLTDQNTLGNLMENPIFKIAFLTDQNTLEISPFHFWLSHLGCHFVQLDLLGSGFLKA